MNWPDIFFRARPAKRPDKAAAEAPPGAESELATVDEASNPASAESLHPLPVSEVVLPLAPVYSDTSDSDVAKDMAEADTLRQLSRSGGVRLIKRSFLPSTNVAPLATNVLQSEATSKSAADIESITPQAAEETPAASEPTLPSPVVMHTGDDSPPASVTRSAPAINLSGSREQPAKGAYPAAMTIFRRRTKIADVARIVLPPRREENPAGKPIGAPAPATPPANAIPASTESSGIVIPPAFPVALPTRSASSDQAPVGGPADAISEVSEKTDLSLDAATSSKMDKSEPALDAPKDNELSEDKSQGFASEGATEMETVSQQDEAPAAHKAELAPDDSRPTTSSLSALPSGGDTREKREFFLSNGERILGHVLSETPDSIYVDHSTLGVLTIPRAQIAQRPVEIILINGDRVVGDIIAETPDSLFVRHASLGILTVPKNQRSTKVVEAILKDGDRILGEVLGETENFTVIRSATLGTVAVPHNRVAMLNRRAEQVEMKALPAPAGAESKSTS